jgi:alpha-tubulin suppressor-like RCC1 family protein
MDCSSQITALTLSATADTIEIGRGALLTGQITVTNPPASVYCNYSTRLSSSDSTIAGVSSAGHGWGGSPAGTLVSLGAVYGRAPGTATITHTAGTGTATISITVIPPRDPFVAVSTGGSDVCTLGADGKVFCGTPNISTVPLAVGGVPTLASVDAGPFRECGISLGKQLYCWAPGSAFGPTSAPTQVYLPADAMMVDAAGSNHACALTAAHAAYCWGANGSGQLGAPGDYSDLPRAVAGYLWFQKLTGGYAHTCALGDDGSLWCWGSNAEGQLGLSSVAGGCSQNANCQLTPSRMRLAADSVFEDVAAGRDHTCALAANGQAYCWGRNSTGQLGTADTVSGSTPRKVAGNHTFTSLSAGTGYTCGLTAAGEAYCWGVNDSGQLGSAPVSNACGSPYGPTPACETVPVLVSGGHAFSSLNAGDGMTCGMTSGGAWCWGRYWGGNRTFSSVPVRVPGQP